MLRRGLKRKYEGGSEEEEKDNYRSSLRHFQNATRRRESLRIKTRSEGIEAPSETVELEKRLAIEKSLMGGANKFLKEASQGTLPCLEAAKTLKLAEIRSDMLKYELNKLKRGGGIGGGSRSPLTSSLAGLSLSHIRIPLSFVSDKQSSSKGKYAVFCIARIGSQIYDTGLLYPVEPGSSADVAFDDDVIYFSRVPPYFELVLEVYSHLVSSSSSSSVSSLIPSHHHQLETPRKIARSISRVVGKSLLKKGLFSNNVEDSCPKFDLIATANLTLEDCSEEVGTYELYVEDFSPRSTSTESLNNAMSLRALPLFGSVCCLLTARPYCCEEEVVSGELYLMHQKRSSSSSTLKKVWGSLMNWGLSLWGDKSAKESGRTPLTRIPVTRDTALSDKGGNVQIRNDDILWEFSFDPEISKINDRERLNTWFGTLSQHASDHRKWKRAAEMRVESLDIENEQPPPRAFKRTRSKLVMFYNDI